MQRASPLIKEDRRPLRISHVEIRYIVRGVLSVDETFNGHFDILEMLCLTPGAPSAVYKQYVLETSMKTSNVMLA